MYCSGTKAMLQIVQAVRRPDPTDTRIIIARAEARAVLEARCGPVNSDEPLVRSQLKSDGRLTLDPLLSYQDTWLANRPKDGGQPARQALMTTLLDLQDPLLWERYSGWAVSADPKAGTAWFDGILTVTMPASGNVAPPGYYFLIVSNAKKVPSIGAVVAIHAVAPPTRSVTALLPVDNVARAMTSSNVPGSVIRHANYLGYLNAIGPGSSALDKADASFHTRKGLANAACHSFESKNFPGYFLRSDAGRIKLLANDGSAAAVNNGTFCAVAGLDGTGFSLQAFGKPDSYVRHRNQDIWVDTNDGTAGFKGDASFALASEDLPVDNALHAIASLSQYGALMRHANYTGYVSSINSAGTALDAADSSFYVRKGNASAACYSFEASNFPGYFLRRNNGAVALARGDGTAQFNSDSTMCLASGLAKQGFSLIAYGTTNVYLRQNNGQLFFAANDGGAAFNADATFSVVPTATP